jgi:hypothetical protein
LADDSRRHGIPVWFSETNIVAAQQWHDEIGHALARCDWFAVVLSNNSVKSAWVKRELLYALNDRRYEGHIVPIAYRPCESSALSWSLAAFQFVDFTGGYEAGCRELLRAWGIGYSRRE